jgi:hypothetical protein
MYNCRTRCIARVVTIPERIICITEIANVSNDAPDLPQRARYNGRSSPV